MTVSQYERLIVLSTQQMEAFERGDVACMQQLLQERGALIAGLPPATPADSPLIERAVECDRKLADAIRERMLALRSRAAQVHQRRTNLNGYRQGNAGSSRLLNFVL